MTNGISLTELQSFLLRLEERRIHYVLSSHRFGAIMVSVQIPGEIWEIEFFDDEEPEIDIYRSSGDIYGPEKLNELWEITKED